MIFSVFLYGCYKLMLYFTTYIIMNIKNFNQTKINKKTKNILNTIIA